MNRSRRTVRLELTDREYGALKAYVLRINIRIKPFLEFLMRAFLKDTRRMDEIIRSRLNLERTDGK